MRTIDLIVVHCTATKEGEPYTVDQITKAHKARGFKTIGYHYVVYLDGSVHQGRPESQIGAHVTGYNAHSIGIAYVGGLDRNNKPKDTRTEAQKRSLQALVRTLRMKYPKARVCGHRDLSPDKNGDGKISKYEWIKACPCFDVSTDL